MNRYALICDHCHHIIKNGLIIDVDRDSKMRDVTFGSIDIGVDAKCPNCHNLSYFFSTDNNIARAVAALDSMRYITTMFSCQGHSKYSIDHSLRPDMPYIKFKTSKPISKKLISKFKKAGFTRVWAYYNENDSIGTTFIDIDDIEELKNYKRLSFHLDGRDLYNLMSEKIITEHYTDSDIEQFANDYLEQACDNLAEILIYG